MKKFKKIISVIGMGLCCFMMVNISSLAAEQSPNWFQDGENWKVKDNNGNVVINSWFCDLDESWYLLDENGCMRSGIINSNGHYYSLETESNGEFGSMRTVNGVYNGVELTFNQDQNSATYGEILSGLNELINTGIEVKVVDNLPENSVYAKDFVSVDTNVNVNQAQQQVTDNQQQQNSNEKIPYQVVTRPDGSKKYWDPTLGLWVTVESKMTHLDEKSAVWDNDMAELAKQVGENMAH